jgi:hypothetical protein
VDVVAAVEEATDQARADEAVSREEGEDKEKGTRKKDAVKR